MFGSKLGTLNSKLKVDSFESLKNLFFRRICRWLLNVTAPFPPDKKELTEKLANSKGGGLHDLSTAAFVFEELK